MQRSRAISDQRALHVPVYMGGDTQQTQDFPSVLF